MAFFFPEAHADIDWNYGYDVLDIELQQIAGSAAIGRHLSAWCAVLASTAGLPPPGVTALRPGPA